MAGKNESESDLPTSDEAASLGQVNEPRGAILESGYAGTAVPKALKAALDERTGSYITNKQEGDTEFKRYPNWQIVCLELERLAGTKFATSCYNRLNELNTIRGEFPADVDTIGNTYEYMVNRLQNLLSQQSELGTGYSPDANLDLPSLQSKLGLMVESANLEIRLGRNYTDRLQALGVRRQVAMAQAGRMVNIAHMQGVLGDNEDPMKELEQRYSLVKTRPSMRPDLLQTMIRRQAVLTLDRFERVSSHLEENNLLRDALEGFDTNGNAARALRSMEREFSNEVIATVKERMGLDLTDFRPSTKSWGDRIAQVRMGGENSVYVHNEQLPSVSARAYVDGSYYTPEHQVTGLVVEGSSNDGKSSLRVNRAHEIGLTTVDFRGLTSSTQVEFIDGFPVKITFPEAFFNTTARKKASLDFDESSGFRVTSNGDRIIYEYPNSDKLPSVSRQSLAVAKGTLERLFEEAVNEIPSAENVKFNTITAIASTDSQALLDLAGACARNNESFMDKLCKPEMRAKRLIEQFMGNTELNQYADEFIDLIVTMEARLPKTGTHTGLHAESLAQKLHERITVLDKETLVAMSPEQKRRLLNSVFGNVAFELLTEYDNELSSPLKRSGTKDVIKADTVRYSLLEQHRDLYLMDELGKYTDEESASRLLDSLKTIDWLRQKGYDQMNFGSKYPFRDLLYAIRKAQLEGRTIDQEFFEMYVATSALINNDNIKGGVEMVQTSDSAGLEKAKEFMHKVRGWAAEYVMSYCEKSIDFNLDTIRQLISENKVGHKVTCTGGEYPTLELDVFESRQAMIRVNEFSPRHNLRLNASAISPSISFGDSIFYEQERFGVHFHRNEFTFTLENPNTAYGDNGAVYMAVGGGELKTVEFDQPFLEKNPDVATRIEKYAKERTIRVNTRQGSVFVSFEGAGLASDPEGKRQLLGDVNKQLAAFGAFSVGSFTRLGSHPQKLLDLWLETVNTGASFYRRFESIT